MKFKNINDFTIDECKEYIKRNPNGRSLSMVQERMKYLLEKEEKNTETKDVFEKPGFSKIQWIDIRQFLEKKHYRDFQWLRYPLIVALLYCNLGFFTELFHLTDGTISFWALGIFVCLYIFSFDSPVLSRIYNIENTDSKYVVVQDRFGKMGLCRCGRYRLVPLLRFKYEKIYPCEKDSYICKKRDKFGVYNATLRKMVLPVVYDSIELREDDALVVTQNGVASKFTTKGYRIIE